MDRRRAPAGLRKDDGAYCTWRSRATVGAALRREPSTAHEGGERLQLIGEEATGRRVGDLAFLDVDLGLDLRNDDLGLVERRPSR